MGGASQYALTVGARFRTPELPSRQPLPALCARGLQPSAYNFPGQYPRRYEAELWLAIPGGSRACDSPALFTEDTTWVVEAPWTP